MRVKSRTPPRAAFILSRRGAETCDIELSAVAAQEKKPDGSVEYTVDVYTLRNVPYRDGIEDSLRYSYEAWLAAGAAVEREREILRQAIVEALDSLRKENTQ
mgnify:CR=1 FL=1